MGFSVFAPQLGLLMSQLMIICLKVVDSTEGLLKSLPVRGASAIQTDDAEAKGGSE